MHILARILCFMLLVCLAGCQSAPVPAATATARPTAKVLPTETVLPTATIQPTSTAQPTATIVRGPLGLHYNPAEPNSFAVDLRTRNLSTYDLRDSGNDLFHSIFDSLTEWPEKEWLPEGFDAQKIIELGKDPGLGLRELHRQGITGKGVSIAIIDQTLHTTHVEYADRLKLYQTVGSVDNQPSMHGPAVASLALGKTTGAAPEANLYFIAAQISLVQKDGKTLRDFTYLAQSVRQIVEINRTLPEAEKIRVLSMSIGGSAEEPGYAEMVAAVNEAKAEGIFVVSSNLSQTYPGWCFNALGREPLADPNRVESYGPGSWWTSWLENPERMTYIQNCIGVPMDSRSYASRMSKDAYEWVRVGGWSWSIPYLAGLYALAAQVDSDITPDRFWQTLQETAQPIVINQDGKEIPLGKIADPAALIAALKP